MIKKFSFTKCAAGGSQKVARRHSLPSVGIRGEGSRHTTQHKNI